MILSPILTLNPEKVERDLAFLMECFREVLEEAGECALAGRLPWSGNGGDASGDIPAERLLQAYSIAFHLLSLSARFRGCSAGARRVSMCLAGMA